MAVEETTLWTGRPSQVTNIGYFIACILIIPIPFAFVKWLQTRFQHYELTTERLRYSHGVLNRQTEELELYRVKDSTLVQPFFLRLFSLGNIVLDTSDRTTPQFTLYAIADPQAVREKIRDSVEAQRKEKRVREID